MKPVMFCKKTQRRAALRAQLDEVRAFERALAEQDAVVGEDADRVPVEVREAADQRRSVARLELGELGAVDDARDHVAHVVGVARIGRDDAVDRVGRPRRRPRLALRRPGDRAGRTFACATASRTSPSACSSSTAR